MNVLKVRKCLQENLSLCKVIYVWLKIIIIRCSICRFRLQRIRCSPWHWKVLCLTVWHFLLHLASILVSSLSLILSVFRTKVNTQKRFRLVIVWSRRVHGWTHSSSNRIQGKAEVPPLSHSSGFWRLSPSYSSENGCRFRLFCSRRSCTR